DRGGHRAQPIQIALREIAAADEQEIGARSLWREHREVVGREEQLKCEQDRSNAKLDADVEKDAEERQEMGRLTREQGGQDYVRRNNEDRRPRGCQAGKQRRETTAQKLHESQCVQLTAEGKQHGEPDERGEYVALLADVLERDDVSGQQDAQPQKCDGGGI